MNAIIPRIEIAAWRTLKRFAALMNGSKVICAVSGGPDSVAMLLVVKSLLERHRIDAKIIVAHYNHGMRGEEGEGDANFVKNLADKLGLQFSMASLERSGKDKWSEDSLRRERHTFLKFLAIETGASAVLLGHNFDDDVETVTMRLIRGTSLRGLRGIPRWRCIHTDADGDTCRLMMVRPLLSVRRTEIIQYLEAMNMSFRTDSSNTDQRYRRNWVRNELLPMIAENMNPGIVRTVNQFSEQMRVIGDFIGKRVDEHYAQAVLSRTDTSVVFNTDEMRKLHPAIAYETISRAVTGTRIKAVKDYRHFKSVLSLCNSDKPDARSPLPGGYIAVRTGPRLEILPAKELKKREEAERKKGEAAPALEFAIPMQGFVEIPDVGIIRTQNLPFFDDFMSDFVKGKTVLEEFVDIDKIVPPLYFRFPRDNDEFTPLGLKTRRRLSSFLRHQKIPLHLRDQTALVCDAEKIIWVVRHRVSEEAKFEEGVTRRVLRISFEESL